jgi:hypothetical protein
MVYNKTTNVKCCQHVNMPPLIYIVSSSELSNHLAIQFDYPLMTQWIIDMWLAQFNFWIEHIPIYFLSFFFYFVSISTTLYKLETKNFNIIKPWPKH